MAGVFTPTLACYVGIIYALRCDTGLTGPGLKTPALVGEVLSGPELQEVLYEVPPQSV